MTSTDRLERRERRDEHAGFVLSEWLNDDGQDDASSARDGSVETRSTAAASTTADASYEGFDIADRLADGLDRADGVDSVPRTPASTSDGASRGWIGLSGRHRPDIHPVMLATLAMFVTAATLTVLTVGGVLPPLGPATGLPS